MSQSDVPEPHPVEPGHGPASALLEPVEKVRAVWITGVVLVNLGINAAFFGPLQVLLGQQAAHFDEGQKEAI
ncbi:hypothetical protein SB764_40515, partial [Paraburkholderia sp. SIMBA_027]